MWMVVVEAEVEVEVKADVVAAVEAVGWVGMGWGGLDGLTRMDDSDDGERSVGGERCSRCGGRKPSARIHRSPRMRKDGSQRA